MKLFLSSTSLPGPLKDEFCTLVGKPATDIRVALFENAADPYPEERRDFVRRNYQDLESAGLSITKLDLRSFIGQSEELRLKLATFNVVWFGGGNTFYLRHLMKASGFDAIIRGLLESDLIYAGGSAGAIVTGPSLKHYDIIDHPNQAPEIIWEGLGLVDFFPLPHWGVSKFQAGLDCLKESLSAYNKDVVIITDEQAIIVENGQWRIVPSAAD